VRAGTAGSLATSLQWMGAGTGAVPAAGLLTGARGRSRPAKMVHARDMVAVLVSAVLGHATVVWVHPMWSGLSPVYSAHILGSRIISGDVWPQMYATIREASVSKTQMAITTVHWYGYDEGVGA
jgi:hypothetical protein